MMRIRSVVWALVGVTAIVQAAPAGSIYARGRARTQSLFTDDVARDVGDVLTIIIEEQSKIDNESSRAAAGRRPAG